MVGVPPLGGLLSSKDRLKPELQRATKRSPDLMQTVVNLLASTFLGGPERQLLGLAQEMASEQRTVFLSFAEKGRCRAFIRAALEHKFEARALRADTPRLL